MLSCREGDEVVWVGHGRQDEKIRVEILKADGKGNATKIRGSPALSWVAETNPTQGEPDEDPC